MNDDDIDPRFLPGTTAPGDIMEPPHVVVAGVPGRSTQEAAILASLRRRVAERLARHRENLAGWQEGRQCLHCATRPRMAGGSRLIGICHVCHGHGVIGVGHLVASEPDPAERAAVRRELRAAIAELEGIEGEIGKGD